MPELTTLERQQNNSFAETDSKPVYSAIKRIFDFISSLCVSVVLLIPMLIIAVIIMIKDFGNPIYAQKRMGRDGKILKVYKFRSMKKGADNLEEMLTPEQLEEYRKEYKLSDDPRLIGYKKPGDGSKCFGARIRRASLDELVQILINICILGNMSVIGPRPILKEELEENYTHEQQKILLSVKPGLTGYWQAYGRNNVCYKDGKRQEMELYYVKNRSVSLDIKILFKTVEAVLKGSGAK
jgi:lipopolysaccharide/colanic/teichoic acid biosynthesis glycosyltransferase